MSHPQSYPLPLTPGDRYTVLHEDGTQHEDTVHSVRYRGAQPEIRAHPTGWRRIVRQLTPRRWLRPLPIVQHARPAAIEVIGVSEVERRALRVLEDLNRKLRPAFLAPSGPGNVNDQQVR